MGVDGCNPMLIKRTRGDGSRFAVGCDQQTLLGELSKAHGLAAGQAVPGPNREQYVLLEQRPDIEPGSAFVQRSGNGEISLPILEVSADIFSRSAHDLQLQTLERSLQLAQARRQRVQGNCARKGE